MSKSQRMGQRNKRPTGKRGRTLELGYYMIITDTDETEKNYLNGLKDFFPPNNKRQNRNWC